MKINDIKGKTALIVGTGALGFGAAQTLLERGVGTLVVTNRKLAKADKQKAALAGIHPSSNVIPMEVDVTATAGGSDPTVVTNTQFVEKLGTSVPGDIDIVLITSGGVGSSFIEKQDADWPKFPETPIPMEERAAMLTSVNEWQEQPMEDVYRLNCFGPVELVRLLAPRLMKQDNPPVIAVIGSVSPQLSGVEDYAASKLALAEHVKRWARNFGFKRRQLGLAPGRAINLVWGFTQSDQMKSLVWDEQGDFTYRGRGIMSATPLGDMATPEVFGHAFAFAVENSYINGNFRVDGGYEGALTV